MNLLFKEKKDLCMLEESPYFQRNNSISEIFAREFIVLFINLFIFEMLFLSKILLLILHAYNIQNINFYHKKKQFLNIILFFISKEAS